MDSYIWRAHYEDDAEGNPQFLTEYDEEHPNGRGFADVDFSILRAVELLPTRIGLFPYLVQIDRAAGMRPIFFRRHIIGLDVINEEERSHAVVHCLGWQKTLTIGDEERNVASYTFIFEDGSCLITDNHNAI